jgi:hypothetical protein
MCQFVSLQAEDARVLVKRADFHRAPDRGERPKENA